MEAHLHDVGGLARRLLRVVVIMITRRSVTFGSLGMRTQFFTWSISLALIGCVDAPDRGGDLEMPDVPGSGKGDEPAPDDDTFPSCDDAPSIPWTTMTGPLIVGRDGSNPVTQTFLTRDCDAFGECTPWTETMLTRPIIDGLWFSLKQDKSLVAMTHSASFEYMSGMSCRRYYTTEASLADDGTAVGEMTTDELRCQTSGGSFSYSDSSVGTKRAVSVTLRLGCLTITEAAPEGPAYGQQTWSSVHTTW